MKITRVFAYTVIVTLLSVGMLNFHAVSGASTPTEQASSPTSTLDKLENHFQKAQEFIKKQAYAEAAAEVRNSSAIVKAEAGEARGAPSKSLLGAEKELDGLASELERGTMASMDQVKMAFSQAHNAMAEYFNEKASESWSKEAVSQAGAYLNGAASALEDAWTWSGRQIESETVGVIH
jgi:hypothetical protein